MGKCPIPGCGRGCKNLYEHYNPPGKATKSVTKSVTKSDKGRVMDWRKKNKVHYNSYMKEHMRKKSAEKNQHKPTL